jgi:hypothetical protein
MADLSAHMARHELGDKGYAQNQPPPPMDGQCNFLGFTAVGTAATLLHKHLEAVPLRDSEGRLKVFPAEENPFRTKREMDAAVRKVQCLLEAHVGKNSWDTSMGPPVTGAEPFTVAADDPRKALQGQQGLKATRKLGKFEPIGFFQSCLVTREDFVGEFRKQNPGQLDVIDAYTLEPEDKWQPKELGRNRSVVDNGGPCRLVYMGYKYGNETSLLNAPQKDPFGLVKDRGEEGFTNPFPEDLVGEANTTVVVFHIGSEDGFPVAVVFTTTVVEAGGELLYCYGYGYWEAAVYGASGAAALRALKLEAEREVCGGCWVHVRWHLNVSIDHARTWHPANSCWAGHVIH